MNTIVEQILAFNITTNKLLFQILKRVLRRSLNWSEKIFMPRQNIVVLVEEQSYKWNISCKGAKMYLNRFCIDEDDAFELSGVYHLAHDRNRRMEEGWQTQ